MIVGLICIVSVAIGAVLGADGFCHNGEGSCCEYNDNELWTAIFTCLRMN